MSDLPPKTVDLIRILAAVDVLFGPWPDPATSNATCFAVHTRQQAYLNGQGLPWRIGGTADVRKAGERILSELEQAGFITLPKPDRAHRHVALTDRGDDAARSLLEFYRCSDSWNVFRGLAKAVERGPGRWATAQHIAEGLGEHDDRIGWALLYPLLSRSLVESAVSSSAQTIFTVRPRQCELAAGPAPALLADPDPDPRLNPIYWLAFDAAEAAKATWKPRRENVVLCPVLN